MGKTEYQCYCYNTLCYRYVHVYQVENVQIIFQHKALHGTLEVCKYSQSLRRGEGGGQGGSTKLSGTVTLLWTCRDITG